MKRFEIDNFHVIGISYKTASVECREKFAFSKESLAEAIKDINSIEGISECVLVSTCNRTDLYVHSYLPSEEIWERINKYILKVSGQNTSFLNHFYYMKGIAVIEHLYEVISGLDSMVLGENQILGQIKYAYSVACESSCTGTLFNRLFHQAFRVGKQVRSTTTICEGNVSVSTASVMLVEKVLGNLSHRNAYLVGAGKIGKMCAKQLIDSGIEKLYISNRTPQRAIEVVEELSGQIVPFEKMNEMFDKVDIIITSVTSSELIIKKEHIENHRKDTKSHLTIIDLGVPRNVDPDVNLLENVHLYNIDNIQDVTNENRDKRELEIYKVKSIIKKAVSDYCSWLNEREAVPVIQSLYENCEIIRNVELDRIRKKFDTETVDAIDLVTKRIIRKILHNPTMKIRSSESALDREQLLESIQELFIRGKVS